MKLSKWGFELLAFLEQNGPGEYTQRLLAEELGASVGSVNKLLRDFRAAGFVSGDGTLGITQAGLDALEPYRVRRAIILAAGFSERLAPVTLSVPKPLVTVKGVRIIDTLLDALLAADITDITVVTGYKTEMFASLREKYPTVQLRENPLYNQSGNITSLYTAVDKLDRAYICDADLYVHNRRVIRKYEYGSCFFGVSSRETEDWCFTVDGSTIGSFTRGGERCYRAVFVAYLNGEDSARCRTDLEAFVRSHGGKEHFWFDVLFGRSKGRYRLRAKDCYADDITEVDTIGDLVKLDESYFGYHL